MAFNSISHIPLPVLHFTSGIHPSSNPFLVCVRALLFLNKNVIDACVKPALLRHMNDILREFIICLRATMYRGVYFIFNLVSRYSDDWERPAAWMVGWMNETRNSYLYYKWAFILKFKYLFQFACNNRHFCHYNHRGKDRHLVSKKGWLSVTDVKSMITCNSSRYAIGHPLLHHSIKLTKQKINMA